jgi:heme-degrading monooxygenase HmoA
MSNRDQNTNEAFYTHALWRVQEGREAEFIEAWCAMGDLFSGLTSATGQGLLIQSITDPTLFYSFGPWDSLEEIQAMRANPTAQEAMRRVMSVCIEATPGAYRVVAQVGALPSE